jgi:acetoin:2,6-dichlorophenolindophenol oxidoreductase subunit alpha
MDTTTKLRLLETMVRIRKTELQLAALFKLGKIPSAAHLYEGQEAIAAGVCELLRKEDCITSTHRGHGHCIAKGMALRHLIAEVSGKKTGCCGGKGGTMHMFQPDIGVMGTIGIVGGGIPLSVGIGLAMQMKHTDHVVVSFFSEGASNNGAFHESLNLSSLWKLPVLFVCENNGYATSVSAKRSTPVPQIGVRAAGYGMAGVTVDGNHVDAVYAAAQEAVDRARTGNGPTLIECMTYRIRGHFEGDDALYRTKEEVVEARKRDPIEYWKQLLIDAGELTEAAFEAMNTAADGEVVDAAAFADASPLPAPEDALVLSGPAE